MKPRSILRLEKYAAAHGPPGVLRAAVRIAQLQVSAAVVLGNQPLDNERRAAAGSLGHGSARGSRVVLLAQAVRQLLAGNGLRHGVARVGAAYGERRLDKVVLSHLLVVEELPALTQAVLRNELVDLAVPAKAAVVLGGEYAAELVELETTLADVDGDALVAQRPELDVQLLVAVVVPELLAHQGGSFRVAAVLRFHQHVGHAELREVREVVALDYAFDTANVVLLT
ncbi:TetR/AcrR family transcriptional regulator [Babesia caballi]|uniref:TetR/AcrR family transcriptional regulator n=1 Tax=Babesia caballi TaxID=5871 RepID=A0AAV4LSZ7_BABCB|nr:TetR/AcrR family transcriptional regulator [Babesia caballi]